MFSSVFMLESAWKLGSWARILDLCRAAWYAEAMSQALHLVSTRALGPRIFCYSPAAAGMTLLGSFVGNVSASLLGYNYGQVMQGLWGYNAALSTLAVGRLGRAPVTRGRPGSSSRRCRERPVALTRRWRRAARWRPRASPSGPRACWMRWICPASPCPSASWRASALQQVTEVPQGQPKGSENAWKRSASFLLGGRVPGLLRAAKPHSPEKNYWAYQGLSGFGCAFKPFPCSPRCHVTHQKI